MNNKKDEINDNMVVDDFSSADIKIKPDFYLHNAIIKAQAALASDDPKSGFLIFKIFVEQIENLALAAKIIKEDSAYHEDLKSYLDSNKTEEKYIRDAQVANKKFGLLMGEIFDSGTIYGHLGM